MGLETAQTKAAEAAASSKDTSNLLQLLISGTNLRDCLCSFSVVGRYEGISMDGFKAKGNGVGADGKSKL